MDADPIAFGLCAWLLTYALHSTVLIGAVWLLTVLSAQLRSSRGMSTAVRERLWRAALFGGVVTASVQIATGFAPFSVRWTLAEPVVFESRAELLPTFATLERFSLTPPMAMRRPFEHADAPPTSAPVLFSEPPRPTMPPADAVAGDAHTALDATWVRILVFVWLAGAILGASLWSLEWRRLFRCLRGRSPVAFGTARTVFDSLLARTDVRSPPGLSTAAGIAAPITFGLYHAEICLPPRTLDGLQHEELEALLAHELAHAVRRDSAWLVLYRAIEILFFFQPLNRLARIRLQDDAEYSCDDWAVVHTGERVALASCLTEIAGWILHERRLLPAPSMAARGSRLSLRVRRLLDETHRPVRAVPLHGLSALAVSAVAAVAFCAPGVDAESRSLEERGDDVVFDARGEALDVDDAQFEPEPEDADGMREEPDSHAAESACVEPGVDTGFDPNAVADAFDSALAVQAVADEIAALEHDFGALSAAADAAPEHLRKRVTGLRERLRSLRECQARVEVLVQLQAQWADTRLAEPSALKAKVRVPNE